MAVKLLIDSSSDIDSVEAKNLGVHMLPIPITFGEEEYMDGENISRSEFYEKLVGSADLPKTSMINEFRFDEAFASLVNDGDEVVAIVLSSQLSGTYNAAVAAAEKYKDKVFVVDSLSATAGIKIMVEYALGLIAQGKSAKEIYDLLESKKNKVQIRAMVDTLKYLKKGGRISPLVAFAGELMGIKPMVALVKGKVEVIGKVVGAKKAVAYINDEIAKVGGIDFDMPFYVIYSGNDQTKIDNYIASNTAVLGDSSGVRKNCLGATIGTHVGPGVIGIAFFTK
ncbi:MAG: DegV family protein [Clostridia bacterium]|nr:DegV family protein [Clostridia bacterium]